MRILLIESLLIKPPLCVGHRKFPLSFPFGDVALRYVAFSYQVSCRKAPLQALIQNTAISQEVVAEDPDRESSPEAQF